MPYDSIVAVLIAMVFMVAYLLEDKDDRLFFKDLWLLLSVVFVLIALSVNLNLVSTNSWTTLGGNTITLYNYTNSPAFTSLVKGYGYVPYVVLLLVIFKFIYDMYNFMFKKRRGK